MDLSGFDTTGVRRVRLTGWTLGGPHRYSVVESCTLEIDHEDGLREVTLEFGDNPPNLAGLQRSIAVLNRVLGL